MLLKATRLEPLKISQDSTVYSMHRGGKGLEGCVSFASRLSHVLILCPKKMTESGAEPQANSYHQEHLSHCFLQKVFSQLLISQH